MKPSFSRIAVLLAATMALTAANAEKFDRPAGIKIGQRMTLLPYVSLSATFDSNVGHRYSDQRRDVMWMISPGANLNYIAERWSLNLNLSYNYHCYCKDELSTQYNQHSYGETLGWVWSSSTGGAKGWSLSLAQSFRQMRYCDDLFTTGDGTGYNADRRQFVLNAAIQRRFTDKFHSELSGSYQWLDYENEIRPNYSLFGWGSYGAGLSAGYAFSSYSDLLASLSISGYRQDNDRVATDASSYARVDRNSISYSAQVGVGTYATERIQYRLLAGWGRFEYADNAYTSDGFIYTATANWRISETLMANLQAQRRYQPSERAYTSSSSYDTISASISKTLIRGKLNANAGVIYRHEKHNQAVSEDYGYDMNIDILTWQLGLSYTLNRYFSIYGNLQFQDSWNDCANKMNHAWEYDRWRATIGMRLAN